MSSTHQSNFERRAEVISSIRGKQKIVIDGFIFKQNKNRDNLYYWVCEKSGVRGNSCQCRGTANTMYIHDQHVIRYHDSSKHNHAPEPSRVGVSKSCNKFKELALISNGKPCTVVRNVIPKTEISIEPYLPMDGALKNQSHSIQASQALSTDQRDYPPQNKTETSTRKDSTEQFVSLAAAYFEKPETESDVVAKGWALKLNRLPQDQRRFAEKIINDTLFEAELGNLTRHGVHFLSSICIGNHCCQK